MIRKGVLEIIKDTSKMQTALVTGVSGEVHQEVECYQNYGFSSVADNILEDGKGSECLLADVQGMSVVVVADDRRYRPVTSSPGDVIIYSKHDNPTASHDASTQRIVLTDDGTPTDYRLIVKLNACKVELKSDNTLLVTNGNASFNIAANGDVTLTAPNFIVNANTKFTGALTSNNKNISDTHIHGGVQTGAGSTGQVS